MHLHTATFHSSSGYGRLAYDILKELSRYKKITISSDNPLPPNIAHLHKVTQKADLLIGLPFSPVPATAHYTMYESTILPDEILSILSMRKKVIVPCEHNFEVFEKAGLPTTLIHPGVTSRYVQPPLFTPFIFLHVANDSGVPERKRSYEVIEAFKAAFPNANDVRLVIKKAPTDNIIPCFDSRISIIRDDYSDGQMAELYRKCHVGVFLSGQEAWGYPHSELMSIGRPVIAPYYGGPKDFLTSLNSYSIPFTLKKVPVKHFGGKGQCAFASLKHLVNQFRFCYENKEDTILKGVHAFRTMCHFSLDRMAQKLLAIL